eukprot:TRINITY_DN1523_c0_g1_i6.p1 TRINITY_DN1523_c0_g1~~TRINITY_DN1523_c0_g1_i6.p1  ORF type:complete len:205 (+),score=28.37 TRINITY_DN1523_c0_g1_i6:2-616(+)
MCIRDRFKILVIGNSSVGKSSLLLRFTENTFSESFLPTIGVDFKIKTYDVDDKTVKMQIWDTAGQDRFKTITSSYYKGSHGIIVVYDISNRGTFSDLQNWLEEIERHAGENISKILVGNKCDLEENRAVPYEEGKQYAEHHNMKFIETSAKDAKNVDQAFVLLARELKSNVKIIQQQAPNKEVMGPKKLDNKHMLPKKKSNGCC